MNSQTESFKDSEDVVVGSTCRRPCRMGPRGWSEWLRIGKRSAPHEPEWHYVCEKSLKEAFPPFSLSPPPLGSSGFQTNTHSPRFVSVANTHLPASQSDTHATKIYFEYSQHQQPAKQELGLTRLACSNAAGAGRERRTQMAHL
jgi:hypothetical protein